MMYRRVRNLLVIEILNQSSKFIINRHNREFLYRMTLKVGTIHHQLKYKDDEDVVNNDECIAGEETPMLEKERREVPWKSLNTIEVHIFHINRTNARNERSSNAYDVTYKIRKHTFPIVAKCGVYSTASFPIKNGMDRYIIAKPHLVKL